MAGASPSFSEVHIIRTLIRLQNRIGRKKLLREIGIGEGSIRTILKKLKTEGLIDSTKKGHKLNDSGFEYLNKYLKKFKIPFKIISDDIIEGKKIGIVVYKSSDKITTGVRERDIAVRTGASGALVLKYDDKLNKLKFPSNIQSIEDFLEFKNEIESMNFKFNAGDVLIVAFSNNYNVSENAAFAIALSFN